MTTQNINDLDTFVDESIDAKDAKELVLFKNLSDKIMETMKWISVKQAMPPNSKAVIVWCPERKNKYMANWYYSCWSIFGSGNELTEEVTHWVPSPTSPDGGPQ